MNECPTIREGLHLVQPDHSYENRGRRAYITPFPRVNPVRANFEYQFTSIWNDLPGFLRDCTSLKSFKCKFKTYCIESY